MRTHLLSIMSGRWPVANAWEEGESYTARQIPGTSLAAGSGPFNRIVTSAFPAIFWHGENRVPQGVEQST